MRRPRQLSLALWCVVATAALPAQRALLDQLPPTTEVGPRPAAMFGAEFTAIELPGQGSVLAIATIDRAIWVLRGKELHRLDRAGKPQSSVAATDGMVGLAADDRFLYGVAGKDLHVLDPRAGVSVRTVPLPTTWPPSLLTVHRGRLHGLVDHTLVEVDLGAGTTKEITKLVETVQWLASDGQELWFGASQECRPLGLAQAPPAWRGRRWPWSVRESAAAWVDGRLLVALERRGGDGKAASTVGFLEPTVDDPRHSLELAVLRQNGQLVFRLDDTPIGSEHELRATLRKASGAAGPGMPRRYEERADTALDVRPERGVTVGEVARIWDLALAAGFSEVRCPAVEALARDALRAASPTARQPEKR